MALLAFVAFLGLAGAIWRLRSVGTSEAPLVAVLPFDASGPVGDSLLADAVLRGVTAKLEQMSDIRVVDVASTHSLPHTAADAWNTGKVLGAQYVLQTSMHWFRDEDGSVRAQITPVLLQVSDGKIKRAGEPQLVFPSDPFTPASSIAALAARELNVSIYKSQKAILAARGTNDTAAYSAFARGDALYWRGMELQPEVASEALPYFERAFTLDPRYAEALGSWASVAASRARAHASPEMLDSISHVARRAQAILPNNARALIAVGRVALLRNQQDDALAAAFRAAGANASVTEAYELLAQVHLLMGDSAAVWRDVERLVRIAPRSPNALENAAMIAMALRRFGDAREYLRRARAIQPSRPDLVLRAAELARQVGNVTEMFRLVHEARTLGAVLRAEDLALLRLGDQDMQSELANSSPEIYDTRTAADSFHYYMEKSKLFLAHRDARLAHTLDAAQTALKSVLASRFTSELDRRMFAESQGWIDAASGDHARVQAAMNDVPSSMSVQRYPNGSFAAFVSCNAAEIDALGGDVERMLPHLVRCLTLPGGYSTNAILGEPALSRHARDPRLAAMLGRIGLGLDRE
jgi:TolB-like protein/Tfp pilus assembly protein PilF